MRLAALLCLVIAASLLNLVATGFTQDVAYRTHEALGSNSSRYSAVGAAIVPVAAEVTSIQFIAAGLPLLIGALSLWRRSPLSTTTAFVVAVELLVLAWCWMVRALAAMPFTHG